MKFRLTVAAALIAAVAVPMLVAGQAGNDETRRTAKAMVNRFVDSWNREDGHAYGENYWPDAELVDPAGVIVTGRDAIVKEHVDLWAGIFNGTRQKATIRRARVLSSNYIVVDFDAVLSGVKTPPPWASAAPGGVLIAHLKDIMEKRSGVWKILYSQNTVVAHPR